MLTIEHLPVPVPPLHSLLREIRPSNADHPSPDFQDRRDFSDPHRRLDLCRFHVFPSQGSEIVLHRACRGHSEDAECVIRERVIECEREI